jgi:hypothetical protein
MNLDQTEGGEQMYLEHGNVRGVPAFSILDETGTIVADSGSFDEASNIGFPTNDEQRDAFETALKTGRPEMTAGELTLLRTKLQEILRAHQESKESTP